MKILIGLSLFFISLFAIDMNTATVDELTQLKGLGAKKAELIVKYRTEHNCFKSKEELLNVKGIGKGFLQKNEANITLSACK